MLTSKKIKKSSLKESPIAKNSSTKEIFKPTPLLQDFHKMTGSLLDFQNLKPISAPSFYKKLPGTKKKGL